MGGKFEVFQDVSGAWRWRLVARNGEILGASESYPLKRIAVKGAKAARRAVLGARVVVDGG